MGTAPSEDLQTGLHQYAINQKALQNYLDHTGQESKLALINPDMAKRIHSQDTYIQNVKGAPKNDAEMMAKLHAMVSRVPPA